MANPGKVDYHVHYHVDGCSADEMRLPGIAAAAQEIGLEEIAVLKHYSQELPNHEARWVYWKRIIPEQFNAFLEDVAAFVPPDGLRMLTGVETEITNDRGDIAIPHEQQERLDMVGLSVHWLPQLAAIQAHPDYVPWREEDTPRLTAEWHQRVADVGVEAILEGLVRAYVQAVKHNTKVRTYAHMYDGLQPLREYNVPVADLGETKLVEIMEPLMEAAAGAGVLWELNVDRIEVPAILRRANELGVRFCATSDAHSLAILREHGKAEEIIDALGLTRGVLEP